MTIPHGELPTLNKRLGKVHMLLVDDDPEILQLMRGLLNRIGFTNITAATDGSEAVRLLKESRESRKEIDIIVTDWNMTPVDGIELIRWVRTASESPNPYLPIVMLTGRSERSDVEIARDAGFTEYLIKPFTAKSLCDRLTLCVDQPRAFVAASSYVGPSRRRSGKVVLPEGVTEDRRKRETAGAHPGKALKNKIGFDINMRQVFTNEVIDGAQHYIHEQSDRFRDWALRDVGELYHILRNAQLLENPTKYYVRIRRLAFSLKSHSGTFGYDLASRVAKSLMQSCENPLQDPQHQLTVMEKHIETLRSIYTDNVRDEQSAVGEQLLRSLAELIAKYR